MNVSKNLGYWFFLAISSLTAFVLVIIFFCPRFVLWQGLDIPASYFNPEVNRAADTLKQIQDPFISIENPSNSVINFRLFFPVMAYFFNFSPFVFLSLPFLGCLLVLGMISHLFYRETRSYLLSFLWAASIGTSSWFFVSTGWLAYFDSWMLLGLLAAVFFRSRAVLTTACLITPWIDERFILALPLGLLVRAIYFGNIEKNDFKSFLKDCQISAFAIAPYFLVRTTSLLLNDASDWQQYAQNNAMPSLDRPMILIEGLWMSLRGVWIGVIAFLIFVAAFKNQFWLWTILACFAATFCINLFIAADISRSMTVLIPAAIMGWIMFYRKKMILSRWLTLAVLVFNLGMPARHVVTVFQTPIHNILTEIQNYKNPPTYLKKSAAE